MKHLQIGLYEKAMPMTLSWREKLELATEAGDEFLEISIDESDEKLARLDWTLDGRRELLDLMFETGLPIRTMCLSGHRKYPLGSEKAGVRKRGLEIMEKALDLAYDLGIRIIQLAGYDVYYDPSTEKSRELFYDGLRQSVEMAGGRGVTLAFETMETEFMNTTAKAMAYVTKINSPWLGVYPDSGNLTNAAKSHGASETEDLKSGAGHIAALHLKETVPGKFREIPYGAGHVNFVAMIQTALDLGVRLFVTEFWHTGEKDYKETIKQSKTFIDKKFAEVLKSRRRPSQVSRMTIQVIHDIIPMPDVSSREHHD
jgi:L-ribulose-5-phosphate 3-epimerase